MTAKNRQLLRQLDDPHKTARLLGVPLQLKREAVARGEPDRQAAVLMALAVAVEILLMAAPRMGNLTRLGSIAICPGSRRVATTCANSRSPATM